MGIIDKLKRRKYDDLGDFEKVDIQNLSKNLENQEQEVKQDSLTQKIQLDNVKSKLDLILTDLDNLKTQNQMMNERLKNIEKQEEKIREKTKEAQQEIIKKLNKK